jgi:hypothetical protein
LLTRNSYFKQEVSVIEFDPREIEIARRMRPTLRDTLGGS